MKLAGEEHALSAGDCVLVPPGVLHGFANPGDEPVRFLVQVTPGELEGYFDELSELIREAPAWPLADMRPVVALMERYDTFAPPLPGTA